MNAVARPTPGFLLAHPAHLVALGFGTGLSPVAPGTVGTALAFPLYAVMLSRLAPLGMALAVGGCFVLGVWACERTGRDLGVADHGALTWDEVTAFLLVLMLAPSGFAWQAFAFLAFRFFDILKPPPIRYLERAVKGGFGVMLDDLVAACYTLLLLAAAKHVVG
jgi:phosphatidylglycerophosphatase A